MWSERVGRLVIAAPQSGAGKTTLCLGLLAALSRCGVRVQPFKAGPDFIDPGLHQLASGVTSHNLDGWMLSRAENLALFNTHSRGKDMALVEGVMGLFDGRGETPERIPPGSTAELALWLDAPVVLVVNAQGQGHSVAALVKGFEDFHPQLRIAGVIFDRIGSPRHLQLLTDAVKTHCHAAVLGGVPRDPAITIPERHLGLHTADEFRHSSSFWDRLATLITEHVDLTTLLALSNTVSELPQPTLLECTSLPSPRIRLGVARDAAFCFYYQDNFHRLRAAGAELIFFSPLVDAHLPIDLDALWIGGGYPELHAATLAANVTMRDDIHRFATARRPIYAECGGLMYLCSTLQAGTATTYPMAGVFPFATRMTPRWRSLGYRDILPRADNPFFPAGLSLRGHEFHYSEIIEPTHLPPEMRRTLELRGSDGSVCTEGFTVGNTVGTYAHLHFGSNPAAAQYFVNRIAATDAHPPPVEVVSCL